uniref:hypothetical protein n=1 Tax=Staphylococcus epidermidis TaxID=1282 RepID=UPI001A8E794A
VYIIVSIFIDCCGVLFRFWLEQRSKKGDIAKHLKTPTYGSRLGFGAFMTQYLLNLLYSSYTFCKRREKDLNDQREQKAPTKHKVLAS